MNLTRFVGSPFTPLARLDREALAGTVATAVRFLDNVIDASRFPLDRQAENALGTRRIGLGITGLADVLVMLGLRYGSDASLALASDTMRLICHSAYRASVALAQEKGSFPYLDKAKFLEDRFVRGLPDDIREAIATHGIRNSHLLAIAPTGTISLLAGNVSSGVEPVFAASYTRNVLSADGTVQVFTLTDHALELWRSATGFPKNFVTASELPIRAHLDMQSVLHPFVDNSISKTITVPADCPFAEFRPIYELAYDKGLKGCTTFRPNAVTGSVLTAQGADVPHCCLPEREAD